MSIVNTDTPEQEVKKLISDVNLFILFYFLRVRPDVSLHIFRSDAEVGIGAVVDHLFSWSVKRGQRYSGTYWPMLIA